MLHELRLCNHTFHFYRMHKHVSVSHKKDLKTTGFNKNLNKYRFCSVEVSSSVKNQVLAVLYKQKKKA